VGALQLHKRHFKPSAKGALGLYVGFKKGCAGAYRYGFNGQEKDNEIKGVGNSINYKARIYDDRLGKFLSVDPLTDNFPWYTPYQFAGNTPIAAIDLDGLEEVIVIKRYNPKGVFQGYMMKLNTEKPKNGGEWEKGSFGFKNGKIEGNAINNKEHSSAYFGLMDKDNSDPNVHHRVFYDAPEPAIKIVKAKDVKNENNGVEDSESNKIPNEFSGEFTLRAEFVPGTATLDPNKKQAFNSQINKLAIILNKNINAKVCIAGYINDHGTGIIDPNELTNGTGASADCNGRTVHSGATNRWLGDERAKAVINALTPLVNNKQKIKNLGYSGASSQKGVKGGYTTTGKIIK
jgi:RHS repeat-associated protein